MEGNEFVLIVRVLAVGDMGPEEVYGGESEGSRRGKDDSANVEVGGEVLSPAGEHVGDDELRRGRVGVEPVEERVVEVGERKHEGRHGGWHAFGVFYARREGWVGR